MPLRFKPIERWPQEPTKYRTRSRFESTYSQTMKLLERELNMLNAREVFIHLFLGFGQIRQDGQPYADAKPTQPGVIISFKGTHGEVMMPCDTYDKWQDNLRAIALSLEALRAVDRYGCAGKGQQYTGWKKLNPAPETSEPTIDDAALFIVACAEGEASPERISQVLRSRDEFESAYKSAARKLHPDAGGDHEEFVMLQQAAQLLRKHHNGHQPATS